MKKKKIFTILVTALTVMAVQAQSPETESASGEPQTTDVAEHSAQPAEETAAEVKKPQPVVPVHRMETTLAIDTLPTANEAVRIVLYNDNTWRYIRDREIPQDSTIYSKYWDTENLSPYNTVELSSLPSSVAIGLVDSLKHYHYPYKGKISSRYGPRRGRNHHGVDLPLKVGDSIYAPFDGRVRYSKDTKTGYGKLVIIRHDNGLETYFGHLSARKVEAGEWVTAGQLIALGGNTGRSSGPHLHFETRYYGQSFDPERLIDFNSGLLRRETFLLQRKYFSIYSKFDQNFDDEIANEEDDKKEAAAAAAVRYYTVRKGDTLSRIAVNNHTTVSKLCQLNGIKSTTVLKIGRRLRVR